MAPRIPVPIPIPFYDISHGVDYACNPSLIRLVVLVAALGSLAIFITTVVLLVDEDIVETQVGAHPLEGWSCKHISRFWTDLTLPGGMLWEAWSQSTPREYNPNITVGYRGSLMETYDSCISRATDFCEGLEVQYVSGGSGRYMCDEDWWMCSSAPDGRATGHPACLVKYPYPNQLEVQYGGHAVSGLHLPISHSERPTVVDEMWEGVDVDNMTDAQIAAHVTQKCKGYLRTDICAVFPLQLCAPFRAHFPPYACSRTRSRKGLEIANVAFAGGNLVWSVVIGVTAILVRRFGEPAPNPQKKPSFSDFPKDTQPDSMA